MQYQDYYKIPAISRDVTTEGIKNSFRKLARILSGRIPQKSQAK